MIELTIHGRGGQGGVTLAKLIATAYFLKGKHVQAFGLYAAERSGAPIQAFVRVDDQPITNHNQIVRPDHVIIIDRALIGAQVAVGLNPQGWAIVNSPEGPEHFAAALAGRKVAAVDATAIAVRHGLGTRTVPIVNTTMLGAAARVLGLTVQDVRAALAELHFKNGNVSAAEEAFEQVTARHLTGEIAPVGGATEVLPVAGLLDDNAGTLPPIKTGAWASRQPHRRALQPPCNHGCPAGNDVQAFVAAVAREHYDEALGIILRTSPFPGICGRVCPAPCMEACNRRLHDDSINIRDLERYVADHGRRPAPTKPWRAERVAIVGSGPAGLSAAYTLARLGYSVHVFEAGRELGGALRTGIPAYRLPLGILDAEIGYIMRHGVEGHCGIRIKRAGLIRLTREYSAVFVATGLQEVRSLHLGGAPTGVVVEGIDFLDRARRHRERLDGLRVVVIGGGNTAMDAARSALRCGARQVRVLYRRTRNEMPAIAEEVEQALEEGVDLDELIAPLAVHTHGSRTLLTCRRMMLGDTDETGRRRPLPDTAEDAQFDVPCDRIILALGQTADLSIWPEGTEVFEDGHLLGLTTAPLFAGGDFATSDGTVTGAIASGRKAALHIHKTVTGEDLFPTAAPAVAAPNQILMHVFAHAPQEAVAVLPPAWRRRRFTEVRLGYSDEPGHHPAAEEAGRCFSCGVCNGCDRCLTYCPEGILVRDSEGYRFDYDYCKGCGICATQCPRGVIYMAELG